MTLFPFSKEKTDCVAAFCANLPFYCTGPQHRVPQGHLRRRERCTSLLLPSLSCPSFVLTRFRPPRLSFSRLSCLSTCPRCSGSSSTCSRRTVLRRATSPTRRCVFPHLEHSSSHCRLTSSSPFHLLLPFHPPHAADVHTPASAHLPLPLHLVLLHLFLSKSPPLPSSTSSTSSPQSHVSTPRPSPNTRPCRPGSSG